jgi:hypothetical protein
MMNTLRETRVVKEKGKGRKVAKKMIVSMS